MFENFNELLALLGGGLLFAGGFIIGRRANTLLPEAAPAKDLSAEVNALRREGLRLREEVQQQQIKCTSEVQQSTFQQLQPLLTSYPSLHPMVQVKPDLPVKNILSLLNALDDLVKSWGYELIGSAWQRVAYNPQLHQPDSSDITEGEPVYIRSVGYKDGERILCPAKVSRTLPGGAT